MKGFKMAVGAAAIMGALSMPVNADAQTWFSRTQYLSVESYGWNWAGVYDYTYGYYQSGSGWNYGSYWLSYVRPYNENLGAWLYDSNTGTWYDVIYLYS